MQSGGNVGGSTRTEEAVKNAELFREIFGIDFLELITSDGWTILEWMNKEVE